MKYFLITTENDISTPTEQVSISVRSDDRLETAVSTVLKVETEAELLIITRRVYNDILFMKEISEETYNTVMEHKDEILEGSMAKFYEARQSQQTDMKYFVTTLGIPDDINNRAESTEYSIFTTVTSVKDEADLIIYFFTANETLLFFKEISYDTYAEVVTELNL